MLFNIVNIILELGEGELAKTSLAIMKNQKAFDLLWKSYTAGEKNKFRNKWQAVGLNIE